MLYVANFTANRIEVMSLATNTIQTSINVMPQPYSLSVSPNGRWLLVAHYGNIAAPGSPANALTLIDLRNNYAKQTFVLPEPPLGLAFGSDNRALVVTTKNFLIFDPGSGSTQVLISIADQAVKTIPQPPQSFPANIVAASVGASADGNWIYGFGDSLIFRYYVPGRSLVSTAYGATPPLGPRAVSVAQDGSYAAMGWIMTDQQGRQFAEFPNPLGTLNVGGHAVDSVAGLVYSEVQQKLTDPPVLTVRDADNLTLREQPPVAGTSGGARGALERPPNHVRLLGFRRAGAAGRRSESQSPRLIGFRRGSGFPRKLLRPHSGDPDLRPLRSGRRQNSV